MVSRIKNIIFLFSLVILYTAFLFWYIFSYNYMVEINFHYFIFVFVLSLFILSFFGYVITGGSFSYNLIDITFFLLLLSSFVFILLDHKSLNLHNEYFSCCLMMGMIYFIIRFLPKRTIVVYIPVVISIFFFIEAFLGIKQIFLNVYDKNLPLLVRGSLRN